MLVSLTSVMGCAVQYLCHSIFCCYKPKLGKLSDEISRDFQRSSQKLAKTWLHGRGMAHGDSQAGGTRKDNFSLVMVVE